MEMPAEVYKETGYQLNQFLDALIPGLIQALIALAASTALGGAIGAVVGAFFGGAGAIPGAVGGAAVGFDLGLAVLGWLGLGFLAYSIGHSLGELTALLELAVRRAWDAPNSPQPRTQIRLAGKDFARSGAILIRLVLQGIAMWLTQKGVNKIGELVAELRKSKLGPRFAAWVEENAAALMRDPRLKPHRGQGSAAKEVVSEAQSPSKLANRPKEEAPPPPPPPPKKTRLDRLNELATDPAQGGKVTPKTMREAEVGLQLEEQGKLPRPITRDPTGSSEFIDAAGQKWDVKGFNSQYAPKGYNTPAAVQKISAEVAAGENVIVDTAKMSAEHVTELQHALDIVGLAKNVIFF
ncbi:MAG: hypothetical protein Q7V20_02785 [Aquabacterium sp.]|uniref:DUF6861 domain-containing protein n=1 Tax=Aquabacterium sp. TaxID=1872578 RepID=UPI002723F442|nr:hypothetical protein [Aquabacterium sp.]MDO9002364.1 hypothetical protein [Aquabacterium sp.]